MKLLTENLNSTMVMKDLFNGLENVVVRGLLLKKLLRRVIVDFMSAQSQEEEKTAGCKRLLRSCNKWSVCHPENMHAPLQSSKGGFVCNKNTLSSKFSKHPTLSSPLDTVDWA